MLNWTDHVPVSSSLFPKTTPLTIVRIRAYIDHGGSPASKHIAPEVQYDNSFMESFFSTSKREELYRRKYRLECEFRAAVDEYIVFYNSKRPHGKLKYKTPDQKEREYTANGKEIEQWQFGLEGSNFMFLDK